MIIVPPPSSQRRQRAGRQLQAALADLGLLLPDQAGVAFREGHMIEAIKQLRAANPGLDLMRAKAALERLPAVTRVQAIDAGGRIDIDEDEAPSIAPPRASIPHRQHKHPPTVVEGDAPGQLRWLLAVAGLLALAAWIGFGGL